MKRFTGYAFAAVLVLLTAFSATSTGAAPRPGAAQHLAKRLAVSGAWVDSLSFSVRAHTTTSLPETLVSSVTTERIAWGLATAPTTAYSIGRLFVTIPTAGGTGMDSIGVSYRFSIDGTRWSIASTPVYMNLQNVNNLCYSIPIMADNDVSTVDTGGLYGARYIQFLLYGDTAAAFPTVSSVYWVPIEETSLP